MTSPWELLPCLVLRIGRSYHRIDSEILYLGYTNVAVMSSAYDEGGMISGP